jgi:hypothetical protein
MTPGTQASPSQSLLTQKTDLPRSGSATHLLEAGHDIRTVQDLMGHNVVKMTTIYTDVLNLGPGDAGGRTWQEAADYCAALDLGERTDWRLPTVKELNTLVDLGIPHPGPTINTTFFPGCTPYRYWSETSYAYHPDGAWTVLFRGGEFVPIPKSASLDVYVRCARGGP